MTDTHNVEASPEVPDVFRTLPRRIAIGAYTFRVKLVPAGHEKLKDEDSDSDGMTVFDEQCIYLCSSLALHRALNVVQHEVSHAINWVNDVSDESTEEEFVTRNTNGLVEVQMRNPRYVRWVNSAIRRFKKESSSD